MRVTNTITEKDKYDGEQVASLNNKKGQNVKRLTKSTTSVKTKLKHYLYWDVAKLKTLAIAVFLPANYPNSVTSDYLRYQVLNAGQAFCSSLASLISSRATLQGFGIGSASASANDALLLTIFLDICSRLTTIVSAHMLGSSLGPECKKYRFFADILNDVAVVLDTLSPVFKAQGYPAIRIVALGLSSACRALCGISVGGSKAALSLHFASPLGGKGDLGDLNAKDSSKETTLALFGMLLGSLIVPRLQSAWSTYTTLMILLSLHLAINYVMVHGLVLRTLNWQRLWFGYALYLNNDEAHPPTPEVINPLERLYEKPGRLRDPLTGKDIGQITFGSSLGKILQGPLIPEMMSKIGEEGYTIWFDPKCLSYPTPDSVAPVVVGYPRIHICYHFSKTSYPVRRAYLHAGYICYTIHQARMKDPQAALDAVGLVMKGYKATETLYNPRRYAGGEFIEKMKEYKWDMDCAEMDSAKPDAVVYQYGYSYDQKSD